MAMLTARDVDLRPRLRTRLAKGARRLVVRAIDARARQLRIEEGRAAIDRLTAMDDDELAARRLPRHAIPAYVFRDLVRF